MQDELRWYIIRIWCKRVIRSNLYGDKSLRFRCENRSPNARLFSSKQRTEEKCSRGPTLNKTRSKQKRRFTNPITKIVWLHKTWYEPPNLTRKREIKCSTDAPYTCQTQTLQMLRNNQARIIAGYRVPIRLHAKKSFKHYERCIRQQLRVALCNLDTSL